MPVSPSSPMSTAALERLLLWVPFASVLWGVPLYLVIGQPAWQHLLVLLIIFVVYGLALFGPPRVQVPLRAISAHLYGAVLLAVWRWGLMCCRRIRPRAPGSCAARCCSRWRT